MNPPASKPVVPVEPVAVTTPSTVPTAESIHKLEHQRRLNRDAIINLGLKPYGSRRDDITDLAAARAKYDAAADAAHQAAGKQLPVGYKDPRPIVTIAGRAVLLRDNGKLVWLTLRDHAGDMQVAVSQKDCSEKGFGLAKAMDLGDIVIATGPVMKTKTGEITVWATGLEPGSKCLTPPPEKHAGLSDVEQRYRKRYVDMWSTPETMRVFKLRSKLVARVRRFLDERDYLEVETPVLQQLAGGAAARPFLTHMNALDVNLFLRIAPELYLKRLLVGGMPRVYEISRNFRNEGVDKSHNPEFTSLEIYQAFGNYETMRELAESLVRNLASLTLEQAIEDKREADHTRIQFGKYENKTLAEVIFTDPTYVTEFLLKNDENLYGRLSSAIWTVGVCHQNRPTNDASPNLQLPYTGMWINYGSPFVRVTYAELFEKALGFPMTDTAKARAEAKRLGYKIVNEKGQPLADVLIINELFEEVAEKSIDPARPTFVLDYPAALSPLTRPKESDPTIAERWDLFIGGMEIGPAYTELNDPDVQEAKFREQLVGIDDEESTFRTFDQDFIDALKVGMPPAGGLGLGIDRLAMLLTGQRTIRDVLLFPMMRPIEANPG